MVRIHISLLSDEASFSNLGHTKFPFGVGHDFKAQGKVSLGSGTVCPSFRADFLSGLPGLFAAYFMQRQFDFLKQERKFIAPGQPKSKLFSKEIINNKKGEVQIF